MEPPFRRLAQKSTFLYYVSKPISIPQHFMSHVFSFLRWLAMPLVLAGIVFAAFKLGMVSVQAGFQISIPAGEEVAGMPARF